MVEKPPTISDLLVANAKKIKRQKNGLFTFSAISGLCYLTAVTAARKFLNLTAARKFCQLLLPENSSV